MKVITATVKLVVPDSVSQEDARALMGVLLQDLEDVELGTTTYGIVEGQYAVGHRVLPDPNPMPSFLEMTLMDTDKYDALMDEHYMWAREAEALIAQEMHLGCPNGYHYALVNIRHVTTCTLCNARLCE